MGQEILKRFDRYTLLDMIAQGGMAEIFRARLAAAQDGTHRVVVLKRILAAHARNADFVKMFRAETKVMMGLSHPNIVQLYDFGEFEGQPYIAMELVDGKNLRPFISRYAEQKRSLPPDFCVYVAQNVAEGLSYAHNFRDRISGESLNLVHRDISPQNILISYEGNVKVIDFGIAKAQNMGGDSTRVGIIKGKPSYLSPEQIAGEALDGRSDVFSLGIVLWESLTGKKLFAPGPGENEYAVLKQIEAADAHVRAPSKVVPTLPSSLDAVVMKALTRDRDKRYRSAEEFATSLRRWLVQTSPDYSAREASKLAREIFKQDIVEDRKSLVALMDKAHTVKQPAVKRGQNPTLGNQTSSGAADRSEDTSAVSEIRLETPRAKTDVLAVRTELKKMMEREHAKRQTGMFSKGASGSFRNQETAPPAPAAQGFPTGLFVTLLVLAVLGGPQLFPENFPAALNWKSWIGPRGTRSAASVSPQVAIPSGSINLKIALNPGPGTTRVLLNGTPLNPGNPIGAVNPADPLEVIVERDQYERLEYHGSITPQMMTGTREATLPLVVRPLRSGTLSLSSSPSAIVEIYAVDNPGEKLMTVRTPKEEIILPTGTYKLVFTNENLGSQKQIIETIREKTLTPVLNVDMTPSAN